MARQDYQVDEDNDLLIASGDFAVDESDFNHVQSITELAPGELRQHPEVGFNARRFKNAKSNKKEKFVSELREQYQADGYQVNQIDVSKPEWWKTFEVDVQ